MSNQYPFCLKEVGFLEYSLENLATIFIKLFLMNVGDHE